MNIHIISFFLTCFLLGSQKLSIADPPPPLIYCIHSFGVPYIERFTQKVKVQNNDCPAVKP